MSTTNLFVELIVIGIGAAIALLLLVLAIFGFKLFQLKIALWPILVIPALSLIYIFGIVVDRIADFIFEKFFSTSIRQSIYSHSSRNIYDDRRLALSKQTPITEQLLYARSRLRISRGWSINSILIAFSFVLLMFHRLGNYKNFWGILIFGLIFFVSLSIFCGVAWKMLKYSDYIKTKEYADFLRSRH